MTAGFKKAIALAAICGATIVGTVAVSAASVDAKGTKKQFCKAAVKVGSDIQPSADPSDVDEESAAKVEKAFHKLEAKAPTTALKNSVADISDFFGQVADGDTDAIADASGDYAKAVTKFATYLATKCVSTQITLPDNVTLPDISLP